MRKYLALLLAVAVAALAGCGLAEKAVEKATEKAVEKATGVSVDEKSGTVTVKGKDGETVTITGETGSKKMPEGLPLPQFPGSKITSTSRVASSGKTMYMVEQEFKGDAVAAADFYEKALKDLGVKDASRTESESDDEFNVLLMGENEKQAGSVVIDFNTATKEGTIAIIWSDK